MVLHVGLPKTGTTWLQALLGEHRDVLRESGLLYPFVARDAMFHGALEVRESRNFYGLRAAEVAGSWQRLCDRARSWLDERQAAGLPATAVLSHEVLAGATPAQVEGALRPLADLEVHVVVTARDLGRLVTAQWQERVKLGDTRSFAAWRAESVDGPWRADAARSAFWHRVDPADTLTRWTAALPRGRGHLVVAPAPGAAPGELWRRFAEALAVDPALAPSLPPPANRSLGTLETALVRQVGDAVGRRLPPDVRRRVVKRGWAEGELAAAPPDPASAPLRCPADLLPRLLEATEAWLRQVEGAGHAVHGDLGDLAPVVADPGDPAPDEVPRGPLAARGARGTAERLVLRGLGTAPSPPRPSLADRVRRRPLLSVVVPAWGTEAWLPACLDSALAARHRHLEVVVVDDGSPDRCGEVAEQYAARDGRVRVVRVENGGLGAARNVGTAHTSGDYLAFLDSDDVVPPDGWARLVDSLERSGSDFAVGSVARWEAGSLHEPPWMRRLHAEERRGAVVGEHPELLGDVFAWDKVFRRAWWDAQGLCWPEGIRYEDQPTTTEAFLRGRFDVLREVVYHWRIRDDGTSITQQRASLVDLEDRWETKRMSWASVRRRGDAATQQVALDRVLPGDLHRYFAELPGAPDAWWELLHRMVRELWGERSLVHSGLLPADRLVGWLVEQGRRDDAVAVVEHVAAHRAAAGGPLPRAVDPAGRVRLDLPASVLDVSTVAPAALAVRPHEV